MELYRRYPKLTTVWCFVEVFVYAGHLFGWSSLLFVLKSEGFYLYLCSQDIADDEQRSGSDRNYTQIYLGRYSDKNNKNVSLKLDWLVNWLYGLFRVGQCTYPCFPLVLLTSNPHSILSKPLAAFPHNHCRNNGQR